MLLLNIPLMLYLAELRRSEWGLFVELENTAIRTLTILDRMEEDEPLAVAGA